jgi:aspartyl aminopeptidase
MKRYVCALLLCLLLSIAPAIDGQGLDVGFKSVWPQLNSAERDQVMRLAEDFKQFVGTARSEMLFVREAVKYGESKGFTRWQPGLTAGDLKPGSRWYAVNRDRTMMMAVIGTEPIESGMRVVTSHIDAVRIEFKTRPFRESNQAVLVDTQVHGGIKNYQWANVPLAVIGRVDRADGSMLEIEIGTRPDDPVLLITDLAPHEDRDFRERRYQEVLKTEELDPILATLPPDEGAGQKSATDRILALLKQQYDITPADFLSADLQIVPAALPRDVGLDRALIGAYGQDDRVSGYLSLRSITEVGTPRFTSVAYFVNNEEVASWNTGVDSQWFTTMISEMLYAQRGSDYSELLLRRAYGRTQVLMADCTTAINPLFPQPQNQNLAARLGYGLVVKEYGAGREANSEFFARMRGLLDREKIRWQTHSYDAGYGGGTIADWFAQQNMDVMDVGIGILSMHSPFEVSSKVDLWELFRGFNAFYRS